MLPSNSLRLASTLAFAALTLTSAVFAATSTDTAPVAQPTVATTAASEKEGYELAVTKVAAGSDNYVLMLKEGTPLVLRLISPVNTQDCSEGDTVNFVVVEDVKTPTGEVLIAAGSPAKGTVTECGKNNFFGIPGKLRIDIQSTRAINDQNIPLTGIVSTRGKDNMFVSIGGGALACPLLFLVKGGNAAVNPGREVNTTVPTNVQIILVPPKQS